MKRRDRQSEADAEATPADVAVSTPAAPFWKFLVLVYLLSLALRLGFVLLVGRGDLSLDEIEYHMLAANLAAGNGYTWFFGLPSTFRPPGYPFLLSALYVVTGPNYFAARIVQSLIAASLPVFTYLLGRRLFGERPGRLGALITALYPPLIVHCAALLTENVFIPLLLLGFWLLMAAADAGRLRRHILASLVVAFAILVRPDFTPFLAVLALWVVLRAPNRRAAALRIGILLGIWLAAVTPWCLRSSLLAGRFVYLDTRAGYNLYVGYRDGADGSFDMDAAQELLDAYMERNIPKLEPGLKRRVTRKEIYRRLHEELVSYKRDDFPNHIPDGAYDLSGVEGDVWMHAWGLARAREFVHAHPWTALRLVPRKFMHFWDLEHRLFIYAYSQNFVGRLPAPVLAMLFLILTAPFACITLLAVFGAAGQKWNPDTLLLIMGPVVYYSALHSLVFGEARLHYPLVPILALIAASGFVQRRGWTEGLRAADPTLRGKTRRRLVLALAVCAGFTGIWVWGLYGARDRIETVFGPEGNTARLDF